METYVKHGDQEEAASNGIKKKTGIASTIMAVVGYHRDKYGTKKTRQREAAGAVSYIRWLLFALGLSRQGHRSIPVLRQ